MSGDVGFGLCGGGNVGVTSPRGIVSAGRVVCVCVCVRGGGSDGGRALCRVLSIELGLWSCVS